MNYICRRSKKIFTNILRILCLRNASWIPKQQSYELRSEILTYERFFVFVNTASCIGPVDLRRFLRMYCEFFVYEMLHEYQNNTPTNFASKSLRTNILLCSWIRPQETTYHPWSGWYCFYDQIWFMLMFHYSNILRSTNILFPLLLYSSYNYYRL